MKKFTKIELLNWWENANEKVRACTYFEHWLGAKSNRSLWLMVNTTPCPTTIAKVSIKAFDWFETKKLTSDFININYYQLLKKKEVETKGEQPTGDAPILHLLE